MNIGSAMFDELKKVLTSLEVKYDYKAKKYETDSSREKADFYHLAKNKLDKISYFKKFDIEAVRMAGIASNEILIKKYADDPSLIPEQMHEQMMEGYRKWYIGQYVDENPYFREMSGHPQEDDFDYIYVDPDVCEQFSINPLTPIHLLNPSDYLALEGMGYINAIIKKYPKKKYLNYIGSRAIDPDLARQTKNFGIIRMSDTIDNTLYEQFINVYSECRDYSASVLYNTGMSKSYQYYDEFMAFNVLIMTIQRMFVGTYQNVISRDFFDVLTIKTLFDCYQIPFIEQLPIERQRLLVKNINKLLHYKSTNRALNEICSLLGYEQLNLMQYYLVKKHKLDVNGNPVFVKKTVQNPDGEYEEVYDNEKMYDIYFQAVDIDERNLALAFTSSTTTRSYIDVVTQDPYWWDDDDEMEKKLYEEDFNFIETKYLSINVMHRLSKMLFEVIHFLRMVLDKKPQSRFLRMTLPRIFGNEEVTIFNVVVFLSAVIAKRNGMNGDILDTTTKVMSVLGFNFRADFPKIRKMIENDKRYDRRLLKLASDFTLQNPIDLNTLYGNIRLFAEIVKDNMATTQDRGHYLAYQKLYKALLITDDTNSIYRMSDGTIAKTFLEYLKSEAPYMAAYVEDSSEEDLNNAVDHVVYRLTNLVNDLKYLSIISEENDAMINALMTLLKFFKSYTTDFTSFDIVYILDDRGVQNVKLMSQLKAIRKTSHYNEKKLIIHKDRLNKIRAKIRAEYKIQLKDSMRTSVNIKNNETLQLLDKMQHMYKNMMLPGSDDKIKDKILSNALIKMEERFAWREQLTAYLGLDLESTIKNLSVIQEIQAQFEFTEDVIMHDKLHISADLSFRDKYKLRDSLKIFYYLPTNAKINIHDSVSVRSKSVTYKESLNLEYADEVRLKSKYQVRDEMRMRDSLLIIR